MGKITLEELFINASETDSKDIVNQLFSKLEEEDDISKDEISANIEFLLESWDNSIIESEAKSNVCILLAEKSANDTNLLRNALTQAVKKLLPPYLAKTGFLRGLGLRDSAVLLPEVAKRYKTMLNLKNNIFVFQPSSRTWGKIVKIDSFTSSVAIESLVGNSSRGMPLDLALSQMITFKSMPETHKLMEPNKKTVLPSSEYRRLAKEISFVDLDKDTVREIALSSHVPNIMTPEEFDLWWKKNEMPEACNNSGMERRAAQARSIHEMHVLLEEIKEVKNYKFLDSDLDDFKTFFTKTKPNLPPKDCKLIVECIAIITPRLSNGIIMAIFESLKDKCLFLPKSFDSFNIEDLEVWSKIPAKMMTDFARFVKVLFSEEYLADIAVHLPLRCLNAVCEQANNHLISNSVRSARNCSSDILVWIWRNRKKCSDELIAVLNMDNIVSALSVFDLPKAWGSAQRELKKLLIDNANFQTLILDNAGENILSITSALQKAKTLVPGERQSLLVKLSRQSPELRQALEQGEARKIGPTTEKTDDTTEQPPITSVHSFKQKMKELDNILNVQVPENREALKVARAHGDFRENSEYDAAKERRDFLSRRRGDLERGISAVIQTDFKGIVPTNIVILGSSVKVERPSGEEETFHILGMWDSDSDNHCVSYLAKLGQALINMKIGDKVKLPDGSECKIKELAPLPESLRAKLADED